MGKMGCFIWGLFYSVALAAQCGIGEAELIIDMLPDTYPQEIHWVLSSYGGDTLAVGGSLSDTLCVAEDACLRFAISDSANDGICCGYGIGNYRIYIAGTKVYESDGNYGSGESFTLNCPPGSTCNSAAPITTGSYTAEMDESWFLFIPLQNGTYSISTCDINSCDTKIWIYGSCDGINLTDGNVGSQKYDDDDGGCGEQAVASMVMSAGTEYYIRIGDDADSCSGAINFTVNYLGPVVGCTDSDACNYQPLATVSGPCIYPGDPLCPAGPDLVAGQQEFVSSLGISTTVASNCDIEEGCLRNYGAREVISFTTHIANNGTMDYYIGTASPDNSQFSYNNCHGHPHYEGYTRSLVFDSNNNVIPVGVKAGYCVMDLQCPPEITGQYSCNPMGISAGCADIYGAGTQCQWFDVTELMPGTYKLAVKVNWDNSPDANGNYEMDYENNWAYACIELTRNEMGVASFTTLPDCEPVTDCNGNIWGNALLDCEGVCGGSKVRGDIDENGYINTEDVESYMQMITQENTEVTNCLDLSADGKIDLYDAALANWCRVYGIAHNHVGSVVHNHCDFPRNITNPEDSTLLGITAYDLGQNYLDISIINPYCRVNGYQFTLQGAEVLQVQSLLNGSLFPAYIDHTAHQVIGISVEDSSIAKHILPYGICRIFFTNQTGPIAISEVTQIINADHEQVPNGIFGETVMLSSTGSVSSVRYQINPNPAIDFIYITGDFSKHPVEEVRWYDLPGRLLHTDKPALANPWQLSMALPPLPTGIYLLEMKHPEGTEVKRVVVK